MSEILQFEPSVGRANGAYNARVGVGLVHDCSLFSVMVIYMADWFIGEWLLGKDVDLSGESDGDARRLLIAPLGQQLMPPISPNITFMSPTKPQN